MEMKKFVVCFERAAGSAEDRKQSNLRTIWQLEKVLEDKNLTEQFNIVEGAGHSVMTITATDAVAAEIRKTKGITDVSPHQLLNLLPAHPMPLRKK